MTFDIEHRENTNGITWTELATMEPRLADLLEHAKNSRDWICDSEKRWALFKQPIAKLVGFHRRDGDPRLRTMGAYDVVYAKLWNTVSGA